MGIGDWLREIGFSRYAQAFIENDIDVNILPSLTSSDLIELGVKSVGHRRSILDAIQKLPASALAKQDLVDAPISASDHIAGRRAAGETQRRALSIMFVDLVESTALSTKLDPEDFRDVITAFQEAVASHVATQNGHVAKFMGDGVLAYFGWPMAHEDDAEQSVRAGLAVVESVAKLKSPEGSQLRARVGIASGLCVIGDLVGTGPAQEEAVVGETPNRAARIQAAAAPQSVCVDDATRRLAIPMIQFHRLGDFDLKGIPQSIAIWEARGASNLSSRAEAMRLGVSRSMIGRDQEFQLLRGSWRRATEGRGSFVLLCGEAGIGKSRLTLELEQSIASTDAAIIRLFCSPRHSKSAFFPIVHHFASGVAGHLASGPADRLGGIDRLASLEPTSRRLILDLISPSQNASNDHTPQKKRDLLIHALADYVGSCAVHAPLLLSIEDVHWSDTSTRDLIALLIRSSDQRRMLGVVTYRPDFVAPWVGLPGVTPIDLQKLSAADSARLVETLISEHPIDPDLSRSIAARADGVPLFLEELAYATIERANGNSDAFNKAVPQTLRASLESRLDRYPAARRTAQICSVIGREVPLDLLLSLVEIDPAEIEKGLTQLEASFLLARQMDGQDSLYVFKHALIRDVAYESLLKRDRIGLHAKVLTAYQTLIVKGTFVSPEVLAYHAENAREHAAAILYLKDAARQSIRRSAMAEARSHIARALDLGANLPASADPSLSRAELLVTLGDIDMVVGGFASESANSAFSEAIELADRADHIPRGDVDSILIRAFFGSWSYSLHAGHLEQAQRLATSLGTQLPRFQSTELALTIKAIVAVTSFYRGDIREAVRWFQEAIADVERRSTSSGRAESGFDIECLLRAHYACAAACNGDANAAQRQIDLAMQRARNLEHSPTLAMTLATAADLFCFNRDLTNLDLTLPDVTRLADEFGYPFWGARARCFSGWRMALRGDVEAGQARLDAGLAELDKSGIRLYRPLLLAMRAEVYGFLGDIEAAEAALREAQITQAETGEIWCAPFIAKLNW